MLRFFVTGPLMLCLRGGALASISVLDQEGWRFFLFTVFVVFSVWAAGVALVLSYGVSGRLRNELLYLDMKVVLFSLKYVILILLRWCF